MGGHWGMLVTCDQMARAEKEAFDSGVDQAALMELAGSSVASVILQQHPRPGTTVLYVGKGNNGGDALVAGRHLHHAGWHIRWRLAADDPSQLNHLPARHLAAMVELCPEGQCDAPWHPDGLARGRGPLVLIDGLLGIGAGGEPRGRVADLIDEILALRQRAAAVVAVDVPSGFNADTGQAADRISPADLTVTFGFLKQGFLTRDHSRWLGRLALVPLPDVQPPAQADRSLQLVTGDEVAAWVPRRHGGWHKGRAGRVTVLAGHVGSTGAASLAATAALRAGAGLVTLRVRPEAWSQAAQLTPPEVMVRPLRRDDEWQEDRPDALVVGPGLGLDEGARSIVLNAWRAAEVPLVLDADGLTHLAADPPSWDCGTAARILTPHPGELRRLLENHPNHLRNRDETNDLDKANRLRLATELAEPGAGRGWTWVLKGGHTLVTSSGQPVQLIATGNPGMASGGMGDTLAGVIGGLLAQGTNPNQAAAAAAWLNGRAAERALLHGCRSLHSLTAGDVIQQLGQAFTDARDGCW